VLTIAPVDASLALTGNRDLLLAAVANVLQNAFKFTLPGTEVTLTAYAAANHVLIDVADHCGGLGQGVAEKMFMPFSQHGPNRSGVGLGLAIAKQSVAASGGELLVRNLPGIGCVFTTRLPRHTLSA
jgi:signal transduction histidine kinase